MSQGNEDVGITQRFASSLAKLGITSEVEGDGLTVTVEGVQIGARIDDHTPEGTMWRLELWVDVGEDDAAAAAASAEVVQSVVAMYGRRLKAEPIADPVEVAEKRAAELEAENAKLRRQLEASRANDTLAGEQFKWIKNALGWSGAKAADGHLWDFAEQVKKHNEQMAAALQVEADDVEARARRCPGEPTKGNMFRHAAALRRLAAGPSNG